MNLAQALAVFTSGQGTYQDFSDARLAFVAAYTGQRASIPVPAPPPPPMTPEQVGALPQFSMKQFDIGGPAPCQGPVPGVPAGEACVNRMLAVQAARNAFASDQNARFNFLTCIRSWALNVNATADITWAYHCDVFSAATLKIGTGTEQGALSPTTPIATRGIATFIPPASTPATAQTGSAPVGATKAPAVATAGPAAQPGKIGGTVEPGSSATAQRDGTGTLRAGTGTTGGTPTATAGADAPTPTAATFGSGVKAWFNQPSLAAAHLKDSVTYLNNPSTRNFGAGLVLVPVLAAWLVFRLATHKAVIPAVVPGV